MTVSGLLIAVSALFWPSISRAQSFDEMIGQMTLIPYIDARESFEPMPGAIFVADTQADIGYLINPDGRFRQELIGSGQNRIIRYIGRTYRALTPENHWVILSKEKKANFAIFDSGSFFRMYLEDGKDRTAYGIHTSGNIDRILKMKDRKQSAGCILVSREMRALLGEVFELNDHRIDVVTIRGLQKWNPSLAAVARDSVKTVKILTGSARDDNLEVAENDL